MTPRVYRERLNATDLFAVLAATAVALAVKLAGIGTGPLALLTLPLVLVCPGYALVAALFPAKALDRVERGLLSLGLSLAVAALGGFVLNSMAGGMTSTAWALWFGGLTSLGSLAALLRRFRQPPPAPCVHGNLRARQWMLFVAAGLIVVAAAAVARIGADQQSDTRFTQLAIVPAGDDTLRLSVRSMEATPVQYALELTVGGVVTQEWTPIVLAPNQQWSSSIQLPRDHGQPVVAILFRADTPDKVYRTVTLAPVAQKDT